MSSPDPAFWTDRTVLITGARGFWGPPCSTAWPGEVSACTTAAVGTGGSSTTVVTPTSTDCDLRRVDEVDALFATHAPDVVIHLAARVGGIGANMARPSDLYLDNLLMGTYVIDAARRHGTDKTVVVGTICSYPKFTPVPFAESSLWQGYPEETNAPYGVAKLAQLTQLQANREQYGQNGVYLLPTNLVRPPRQVPPGGVARHPGADQKDGRGRRVGCRPHRRVGHRFGVTRVLVRRRRRRRHPACRRALQRPRPGQPGCRPRTGHQGPGGHHRGSGGIHR